MKRKIGPIEAKLRAARREAEREKPRIPVRVTCPAPPTGSGIPPGATFDLTARDEEEDGAIYIYASHGRVRRSTP